MHGSQSLIREVQFRNEPERIRGISQYSACSIQNFNQVKFLIVIDLIRNQVLSGAASSAADTQSKAAIHVVDMDAAVSPTQNIYPLPVTCNVRRTEIHMVIQGICIVKTYDIDIGEHVKNRHFLLQQSIDIH